MKVLVVEDEHRIARAIKDGLTSEGYAVDLAFDGEAGYHSAKGDSYDIILLDLMMPKMDGLTVCKKLRQDGDHTPIIILTAKDQNKDVVKGLDTGADDYLPKPFSFEVLLARMRALLRRPAEMLSETLTVADLELDPVNHTTTRAGQHIMLSQKEFSILEHLLRNKNRIVSKHNIMTHVWDFDANVMPNNVEVFIAYLRAKIDKPFHHKLIETVRGFGYIIRDDQTA